MNAECQKYFERVDLTDHAGEDDSRLKKANVLFCMGVLSQLRGEYADANVRFRACIIDMDSREYEWLVFDRHVEPHFYMCISYVKLTKYTEAKEAISKALLKTPRKNQAYLSEACEFMRAYAAYKIVKQESKKCEFDTELDMGKENIFDPS